MTNSNLRTFLTQVRGDDGWMWCVLCVMDGVCGVAVTAVLGVRVTISRPVQSRGAPCRHVSQRANLITPRVSVRTQATVRSA